MANKMLKSKAMVEFFATHGHILGSYFHEPNHPANTNQLGADLWGEFTTTMVTLRESHVRGLEPLSDELLTKLDVSMRKQRVWLGALAPTDSVFLICFVAWTHTYFFHHFRCGLYINIGGGVG